MNYYTVHKKFRADLIFGIIIEITWLHQCESLFIE